MSVPGAERGQESRLPWRNSVLPHLPVVAVLAVFSVILTWPLVTRMRDTLTSWGDPVFQMWTIAWNWHALTTDPLSIFDANVFYPWRNVLAYSDHLFGQTLLVLPVLAITDNGILADNISVFLALILSGLAMYLLVYDLTGNRGAAVVAGVAFAFAPPRLAHFEHLHVLSAQWLPLALLCLHRAVARRDERTARERASRRRWPWAAGVGAMFFAQGLFGVYFFYFMIVMLVIAGGVYLAFAVWDGDRGALTGLGLSAVACAVAGVLLIPTLWPYQEVHDDLGIEREAVEVNFWSAKRSDYLAAWPGNDLYGSVLEDYHRDIERDLFPGLLIVGLAAVGVFYRRGGRVRWVFLAIVGGSVILSFGLSGFVFGREIPLPYRVFYDWLPGFRAIRVPARFGHLALVGLGGLAGFGASQIWCWLRPYLPERWPGYAGIGAVSLALLVLLAETSTSLPLPDPLPVHNPREDYAYIADNPGPSLELPMGDGPVASAWPNFWSTKHWSDVANGFSGLVPPTYDLLRERSRTFPDEATVQLLQGVGIEHVIVHADMQAENRAELEDAIQNNPAVTLALPGPDAVYDLAPDPWMWRIADAVPEGETLDLPDISSDPLAYGFLIAILQRTGHDVSGNGVIDYFELEPADSPRCYAILRTSTDPAAHGYADAEVILEEAGYRLYRGAGCE